MIPVNSDAILGVALDQSGRLAARKEHVDDRVFSYEFAYDAEGRLTRMTREGVPVEEYAYGAQGRRSEDTSSFRSVMGRTHEYDDLGRLRRAGNVEYKYDHADRLASRADGVRVGHGVDGLFAGPHEQRPVVAQARDRAFGTWANCSMAKPSGSRTSSSCAELHELGTRPVKVRERPSARNEDIRPSGNRVNRPMNDLRLRFSTTYP